MNPRRRARWPLAYIRAGEFAGGSTCFVVNH
jgi:hypothetical protein